jgi:eukaryotic-like serine/threonine-protein kinase
MQQEQTTLSVGATIRSPYGDRYVIEGFLGMGGFGAVYLVRDRRVKQHLFALKEVIDPKKRDRERFIFEAEILKRLDHWALPHVYQMFEDARLKRVYMLMDYIEGRDLEALRKEQPDERISLPLVLNLMAPIVDALVYLHHQDPPIVHRDIKPENIIVPARGDEAVLVDFSIAKEYVEERTTTVIRHGSPGYAALEQYGSGTTPRTDIYGLAATIYTLLTGSIPPDAITRAIGSKGFDPLEPANLITPDVPWAVAMTIERAMSISSNDRFATVEEFWQELKVHSTQQRVDVPDKASPNTPQPLIVLAQAQAQAQAHITSTPASLQRSESFPSVTHNTGHTHLSITPTSLQQRLHLPPLIKYRSSLPIFLVLLLIIAIGTVSYALLHGSPSSAPQKATPASATPQVRVTSAAVSPTSTLPRGAPKYPILGASYTGTVVDLLAKEKTSMVLTRIQQNQGSIQGYFQGLGFVGPFKGTITPSGHLQFKVEMRAGQSILSFEGDIKVGGDIVGSFEVLLSQGQPTGESGLWNVASKA